MRSEGTQKIIPTGPRSSRADGAPATKTFIALAVVFFALTGFGLSADLIFETLAQWNPAVAAGEWWRIFTPILLHATILHIAFNMWALWVLGPQIERGVGTWPFVSLFVASAGVGGAFVFYLGDPLVVAVGASGAIFGLFGVWLSWAMHRSKTTQGRAMLRQIGVLLLINAAIPFMVPTIAWQAHLGGLIAGFVISEIWSRLRGSNIEAWRTVTGVAVAVLAALSVMI